MKASSRLGKEAGWEGKTVSRAVRAHLKWQATMYADAVFATTHFQPVCWVSRQLGVQCQSVSATLKLLITGHLSSSIPKKQWTLSLVIPKIKVHPFSDFVALRSGGDPGSVLCT